MCNIITFQIQKSSPTKCTSYSTLPFHLSCVLIPLIIWVQIRSSGRRPQVLVTHVLPTYNSLLVACCTICLSHCCIVTLPVRALFSLMSISLITFAFAVGQHLHIATHSVCVLSIYEMLRPFCEKNIAHSLIACLWIAVVRGWSCLCLDTDRRICVVDHCDVACFIGHVA